MTNDVKKTMRQTYSWHAAVRKLLGITEADIGASTGYAPSSIRTFESSGLKSQTTTKNLERFYQSLVDSLGEHKERFLRYVGAFTKINAAMYRSQERMNNQIAFRIALGIDQKEVAEDLKCQASMISRLECNLDSNDVLLKKVEDYCASFYSSLSSEEQKDVDDRASAILLSRLPAKKNMFRRLVMQSGLLKYCESRPVEFKEPEKGEDISKIKEELKECTKERDELKRKYNELMDAYKQLWLEKEELKDKSGDDICDQEPIDDTTSDINVFSGDGKTGCPWFFENCQVTINVFNKFNEEDI